MEYPNGAAPLEPEELEGIRFGHVTTRDQLDALEHANVQQGLAWLKRQKKADLFTEQFVRRLHQRLFSEVWSWAGTFRLTGKNIGVEAYQISTELRNLLGEARFWLERETYPPKEFAARFHHRLVAIHPFPNGNGRHARIMGDAILVHAMGQPGIDWAGGQDLQKPNNRRQQYISALRDADRGDFARLLEFVGL